MRRRFILVSLPVLIWLGIASHTLAEAPLCALSSEFEREMLSNEATIGAAVYDLRTGTIWSGGHSGPFALHSVIKPPVAWAVLSDAEERGRELTTRQRQALFHMVAWSQNPDVTRLLSMIGGLSGLTEYYERWGVTELIELTHRSRWGLSQAEPAQLARLYAALAMSDAVAPMVRAEGFELLRAVVDFHRWGATIPEGALSGWESLIKTGNYTIPAPEDDDSNLQLSGALADADEAVEAAEGEAADPEPVEDAEADPVRPRPVVRMNSAAIWLGPPWQGGQPRYVVTIMQESVLSWAGSRELQNRIGEVLAQGIARRELGQWSQPSSHCIKRALS